MNSTGSVTCIFHMHVNSCPDVQLLYVYSSKTTAVLDVCIANYLNLTTLQLIIMS